MAPVLEVLAAISYPTVVKINIGPLSISPHGVGIAVGFLLGARIFQPEVERKGVREEDIYPLLIRAFIGSMVGARVAYVINHLSEYESVLDIFKVWKGGISLLGGFIGAILLGMPAMRSRRLSFWKVMDAAAPGMVLGVIVGRIGDLIVGDHLGKTTSLFFGFECPDDINSTASPCLPGPGSIVHQTALYDLLMSSLLFAALLWLRKHKPRYDGFLIMVFGAWYGCQRIIEDFLRADKHIIGDSDPTGFGLTGSQVTAIITVVVCVFHLVLIRRTPKWGRWDELPPKDGDGRAVDEAVATTVQLEEEAAPLARSETPEPATSMPLDTAKAVEAVDEE